MLRQLTSYTTHDVTKTSNVFNDKVLWHFYQRKFLSLAQNTYSTHYKEFRPVLMYCNQADPDQR